MAAMRGRPARRTPQGPQGAIVATAQRAQEPDVEMIDEVYRDESEVIIAEAKAKLGEKANGMAFCYGDPKKPLDYYTRQGYMAVVLPNDKGVLEQVTDRGDPLLMIDKQKDYKRRAAPGILAATQLSETANGAGDKYGVTDQDGVRHAPEKTED